MQLPSLASQARKTNLRARSLRLEHLAALCLMGCASATGPVSYPPDWADAELATTPDGCPRIAGRYANHGSATSPAQIGAPPDLSEVFARIGRDSGLSSPRATKRAWPEAGTAAWVKLDLSPESLHVTFVPETGASTTLDFRRYHFSWSEERYDDLFTCYAAGNGARLRFFAEPESHSTQFANLYLEVGGTLVHLLKAADGSLVVQWRSESLGISSVLLGSHMRFNSVWWKYPPR